MQNDSSCFECECGKVHRVETEDIKVGVFAINNLVDAIKNSKFTNILLLGLIKHENIISFLKRSVALEGKTITQVVLKEAKPTISEATNLEDMGQELVVAIGNEELISVAKYYAYSLNCELFIFPIGNFLDFTFSKYSRLYDGVEFSFYEAKEPSRIYVSLEENSYNIFQSYYISSKFISVFENVVREYVYERQVCQRLKDFLKNTLNEYLKVKPNNATDMNYKNIWTLIRLGQAMSFYGETKGFFGGDLAISNFLQAINPLQDFLKLNTISLKLIINSYSCFCSGEAKEDTVNLNRHIMSISKLLKITPTEVIKRLADSILLKPSDKIKKRFNNYFPYLKGVLEKCLKRVFMLQSGLNLTENILKEYGLNKHLSEQAYANCVCMHANPCLLSLIFSYGYLDKLL